MVTRWMVPGPSLSTGCRWKERGCAKLAPHSCLLACVQRPIAHTCTNMVSPLLLPSSVPPPGKRAPQGKEGTGRARLDLSKLQGVDKMASGS